MLAEVSPLKALQSALAEGRTTPAIIAGECAARANGNASRNTYIHFDADALADDADSLEPGTTGKPLLGVPISLKDLFDLAGTRTTAGTRCYESLNPPAVADSSVVKNLKRAGCLITGKTHLHPLAYGITGENPDFGDCLQPRDAGLLTGGSSSGAAASVQEGSALAAIGTDTGGSVRTPATMCGLAGYRASHSLRALWPSVWAGGMHLSPSFDTIGLLLRDPRDLAPLAESLFQVPAGGVAPQNPRIGCVAPPWVADANADVLTCFEAWKQQLRQSGATVVDFDPIGWNAAIEIYAPIQAHEAYLIHRRHLDKLEPTLEPRIAERLRWGASLTEHDLDSLRSRHLHFRAAVAALLAQFDFLMLPSAPINRLLAGADFTAERNLILRYTTPFSLGGLPVVSLPGEMIGAPMGTGIQLAAPQLEDAALLAYVATLRL